MNVLFKINRRLLFHLEFAKFAMSSTLKLSETSSYSHDYNNLPIFR